MDDGVENRIERVQTKLDLADSALSIVQRLAVIGGILVAGVLFFNRMEYLPSVSMQQQLAELGNCSATLVLRVANIGKNTATIERALVATPDSPTKWQTVSALPQILTASGAANLRFEMPLSPEMLDTPVTLNYSLDLGGGRLDSWIMMDATQVLDSEDSGC